MRLTLALCLSLVAAPALSDTRIRVIVTSTEAGNMSIPLVDELLEGLAGDYAGCPVMFIGDGAASLTVDHVPGPPEGWKVWIGPDDAPLFETSGLAGETGSKAVLDWLCRDGGAEIAGQSQG